MLHAAAEIFKTDGVPFSRRLRYWNEIANTTFGAIAIDARTRDFTGNLQRRRLGELAIVDVTSTPAHVHGGSSRDAGSWFLLLNEHGSARFVQGGREALLQTGELTALRADQPYRIEFSQRNRCLVLKVPNIPSTLDLDAHTAVRHYLAETALLCAFVRRVTAIEDGSSGCISLTRLAQDLAALTWPTSTGRTRVRSMMHWRQRAFDTVANRINDPDLSAATLARKLDVSVRFVHLIFASAGYTASAYILEKRLEQAAHILRENPAASITNVAFEAGFADLSRFCRTFRKRFGVSARRYRAG